MAVGEPPTPAPPQEEAENNYLSPSFFKPSSTSFKYGSTLVFGSFKPDLPSNIPSSEPPLFGKATLADIVKGNQPSFAEIVKGHSSSPLDDKLFRLDSTLEDKKLGLDSKKGTVTLKPTTTYLGKPAVIFSNSDKLSMIQSMKYVLIGKFTHGRPSILSVKDYFANLKLKGLYNISIYDSKHLILECANFDDYVQIWMEKTCYVAGFWMRVFQWREDFHPSFESPVCPVWVHLPGLPIFLYQEDVLTSIANTIGKPLALDSDNINRSKLGCASLCVEVDVSTEVTDKIWIEFETKDTGSGRQGFWQKVILDPFPPYCTACSHLGHSVQLCLRTERMDKGGVREVVDGHGKHREALTVIKECTLTAAGNDHGTFSATHEEVLVEDISLEDGEIAENIVPSKDRVNMSSALGSVSGGSVSGKLPGKTAAQPNAGESGTARMGAAAGWEAGTARMGAGAWVGAAGHHIAGQVVHIQQSTVSDSTFLKAVLGNSVSTTVQTAGATTQQAAGAATQQAAGAASSGETASGCLHLGDFHSAAGSQDLSAAESRETKGLKETSAAEPAAGVNEAAAQQANAKEATQQTNAKERQAALTTPSQISTKGKIESWADLADLSSDMPAAGQNFKKGQNRGPAAVCEGLVASVPEKESAPTGTTSDGPRELGRSEIEGFAKKEIEMLMASPTRVAISKAAAEHDVNAGAEPVAEVVAAGVDDATQQTSTSTVVATTTQVGTGTNSAVSQPRIMGRSVMEGFAKNEIEMLMASPTRIGPVFKGTIPNIHNASIFDIEGRSVPCSEVIKNSPRIANVRKHFQFLKNEKLVATLVEQGKYEEIIKDVMETYTKEIHLSFTDQQESIYRKYSTTEKDIPLSQEAITKVSAVDEIEWTTPKRRGRNQNRSK